MEEIWKTIRECPLYSVSNLGKIRRDFRTDNPYCRAIIGRILKPVRPKKHKKYVRVFLHWGPKDGKRNAHFRSIHKLVAEAFIGKKPSKFHVVNHKDCDPSNNRVDNLEWVTHQENVDHAHKNGRYKMLYKTNYAHLNPWMVRGENNGHSKLTYNQVNEIRNTRKNTKRAKKGEIRLSDIAKKYEIGISTVSAIINRIIWRHI